jgi:hypothetical protein
MTSPICVHFIHIVQETRENQILVDSEFLLLFAVLIMVQITVMISISISMIYLFSSWEKF